MKRDLISGVFWLCGGVGLCVWSSVYPLGTLAEPGSGMLPLVLGALISLFSLVLIGAGLRSRASAARAGPLFSQGWKRVSGVVGILLLAGLLFERLGYLVTFFLLSAALMGLAEERSWKQIVLVALCATAGIHLCFVVLLKQPLPTGLLGI
ncbi:MAG: tripartite tricarboxylate transporter TctB family protein [Deltaproteobacteria bacterium]|nr:tripartite tricarboxylate transporter TctB family protein [Deltaproteobacteria bacterium]